MTIDYELVFEFNKWPGRIYRAHLLRNPLPFFYLPLQFLSSLLTGERCYYKSQYSYFIIINKLKQKQQNKTGRNFTEK